MEQTKLIDCSKNLNAVVKLSVPPLDELAAAIREGLSDNFESVNVDITACPDLSTAPFGLIGAGIGEHLRIGEVGGLGNLFPTLHREKIFNLQTICETCELRSAFVFGPGAGPRTVVGVNCEMVANAVVSPSAYEVQTKIACLQEGDQTRYRQQTITEPLFALMANLAISDGAAGKPVVRVKVRHRTGQLNFPESIQRAVAARFDPRQISLAGVFVMTTGKAKLHVMPDFPVCNFTSENEIVSDWLQYFEMNAPLVCCSVLHSSDPDNLALRLEHTHCFSEHGDAGHYHDDVTPEIVEYEGYFAPAEAVYRIDKV